MKSLQEQLLKAGLVDKNKARQSAKSKHRQVTAERKAGGRTTKEVGAETNAMRARNAERDRVLNQQQQAQRQLKAIAAQIRQLVELNRVPNEAGDREFNFIFGKKVRKLEVTSALHDQLTRGRLSIVALPEKDYTRFHLVPRAVAEKIAERDQSVVIENDAADAQETDEDDPYAAFKVPDDLMW